MNKLYEVKTQTGYELLFKFFHEMKVDIFSGVTGGGVIHFLKHLSNSTDAESYFFTLGEYSAGFVPLGGYLAEGKIGASVATLGAATNLIACGLIDAKLHDIPAIYIVPAYDHQLDDRASLQDSSKHGSNIVHQLSAECPDSVFVFDQITKISELLEKAERQLQQSKPIVFILVHSALSQVLPFNDYFQHCTLDSTLAKQKELDQFVSKLKDVSKSKSITILVGEEMARYEHSKEFINRIAEKLNPYLLYSMNGANAVDQFNEYCYGYLGFGGNDLANEHFKQLDQDDVLLVLGACPDEYTVNLNNFTAGHTFYCTKINDAYGQINHSIRHRSDHEYDQVIASLEDLALAIEKYDFDNLHAPKAPKNLNTRTVQQPHPKFVNMELFYQKINAWWPKNSIAFSDVCLAYKDRQYVTQRPNNNIDFYALYRGSAMGNALGLAVGAKLANSQKNVFAFTGDGCFKLFAGSLAEASDLGITLFVLNNEKFSIVEQGLRTILADIPQENWHAEVKPLDYCLMAQASGWRSATLNTDLSNLIEVLDSTLVSKQSLLIEIPVDPNQILGINPRVHNL